MTPSDFRRWREAMGWTQATAAVQLGVDRRTYRYYERGLTSRGAEIAHVPRSIGLAALALRFARDVGLMSEGEIEDESEQTAG